MTTWALLAPGPSATAEQAQAARAAGVEIGVVSTAYKLYPSADFICATDQRWWRTYRDALALPGKKFSPWIIKGVEQVRNALVTGSTNSGVLALECAKRLGATKILLLGFDMHGTHFFGKYENGLSNTSNARRNVHKQQYATWARANR